MKSLFQDWDQRIRGGDAASVKISVETWIKQFPDKVGEHRLELAQILRRLGQFQRALRILHPLIRPSARKEARQALPPELIEYAGSLIQNGSLGEGRSLLEPIRFEDWPQRNLFLAFSHFAEWNYLKAEPLLRDYCKHPLIDDYARLIGHVNWAAALVVNRQWEEALQVLPILLSELQERSLSLLYFNTLEIMLQMLIFKGDLEEAQDLLTKMNQSRVSQPTHLLNKLYFKKWELVLESLQGSHKTADLLTRFECLRQTAVENKFSNVVRDCDRWRAQIFKEHDRMDQVYWGTRWKSYRTILELDNPWYDPQKSPSTPWHSLHSTPSTHRSRDFLIPVSIMNSSELPSRLLKVLWSDFYSSCSSGELINSLYEKEFYHPEFSIRKLHQVIHRAKDLLRTQKIPMTLGIEKAEYILGAKGDWTIILRTDGLNTLEEELSSKQKNSKLYALGSNNQVSALKTFTRQWRSLIEVRTSPRWYSSTQLALALKVSSRTCRHYLRLLAQTPLIEVRGHHKQTRYRLKEL